MNMPRANYQNWLSKRRTLLTNAGTRLSRAVSTEWTRFRRSSWPTAEQAVLGLLRSSGAFLTAPLHVGYRPGVRPDAVPATVPIGRTAIRTAVEGRTTEPGVLPINMPNMPNVRSALSNSRPMLVANVRELRSSSPAKREERTVPLEESQSESDKAPTVPYSIESAGIGDEAHKNFQAALASAIENVVHAENRQTADQKLDSQLSELLDRRCKEFCGHIESRLNFFYDQTVLRLDALSDQIVKKFCESLSRQAAATLNAVVMASAQQSKSALGGESEIALDRFSRQINDLSEVHLDAHRKEVQNLSSNLQVRLRRVAYTLEEVGTRAVPRT